MHWRDRGPVFGPGPWQARCGHGAFGCFRVDVVRNPATRRYVLWFNEGFTTGGYQVMTAPSPLGPWSPQPQPRLGVPARHYGDEALLAVGDRAWIAYTVVNDGHPDDIAFQALDRSWTSTIGPPTTLGEGMVEAPALFPDGRGFGFIYSDPACPYCSGTGTAFRTAASPQGPWSPPTLVSPTSCAGQPAFVADITYAGRRRLLYSSDLWDHGVYNEARARVFLTPLNARPGGGVTLSCRGADPPPP